MKPEIKECKDRIEELKKQYIKMHTEIQERKLLIVENNVEARDVKGYHGREILELLQNADDAFQKSILLGEKNNKELEVEIVYSNDILSITNTGTFFDYEGVKSIIQGNLSTKPDGFIGNKGTGFRSVLNWSTKIRIKSGYYNLEFSKEYVDSIFEEIKDAPQIQKQIKSYRGNLHIPILSIPKFINMEERYEKTTIELEIDSKTQQDINNVQTQLESLDISVLLFLPNVSKIKILLNDKKIVLRREILSEKKLNETDSYRKVVLYKLINDEQVFEEQYDLFDRKKIKIINEKNLNVSIAIPANNGNLPNKLYTYFPLFDTVSPFNCIMHATYELSDQRNTIVNLEINKFVIKEQLEHLLFVSNYYYEIHDYKKGFDLLIPSNFNNVYSWKFPNGFAAFHLEDYYIRLLSEYSFLINVNNERINILSNPKIIFNSVPSFISGNEFKELVSINDSGITKGFINYLASKLSLNIKCDENYLTLKINVLTERLSIEERVKCYDWWEQNFEDVLPHLIEKQNGDWLVKDEQCYFLDGDFDGVIIPEFVKVPSIKREYQEALHIVARRKDSIIQYLESSESNQISRAICNTNLYHFIKFNYKDRSNIISTINSSVSSYENAKEFVEWLWHNYGKNENWKPANSELNYNFPTDDNQYKRSTELYFKSNLNYLLFDENYNCFIDFAKLNIEQDAYEDFKSFIFKFGVLDFPKIERQKVNVDSRYKEYLTKIIRTDKDIPSNKNINYVLCEFPYVKNIEKKLESISTCSIIEWICRDGELHRSLTIKEYLPSEYSIHFKLNLQQILRTYDKNRNITNYLLFVFNNSAWIELDGKRYKPSEVILDCSINDKNLFNGLIPILDYNYANEIALKINEPIEKIINILELFAFCSNATDLDSNTFYDLLLKIQNLKDNEKAIELTKNIYRIIDSSTFNGKFQDSLKKREFFEKGKVYTRYHGFQKCSDVFLPSPKIVDKKNTFVIEKNPRTNNEKFKEIFNCRDYNIEPKIITDSIIYCNLNDEFERYFNNYKKYIKSYVDNNANIKKVISSLTIKLVSRINVIIENKKIGIVDDFREIRQSASRWFITYKDDRLDYLKLSLCIQNIFSNIANTPNFDSRGIGELFRITDDEQRKIIILDEFGSIDAIQDLSVFDDMKNNFIEVLHNIDSNYDCSSIKGLNDFESYDSMEIILNVLKSVEIVNLSDLKNRGFRYDFDFSKYYVQKTIDIINNEKTTYKNYLYHNALNDEKKQDSFLKDYYKFQDFEFDEKINDIIDLKAYLKEIFGKWDECKYDDCEKIYINNYYILNPDNKLVDEIANSYDAKQYIYFNKKSKFDEWISHVERKEIEIEEKKNLSPYDKYRNMIPIELEPEHKKVETGRKETKHHGAYSQKYEDRRNGQKKINGNIGEQLIFNMLKNKYGDENVIPKSEAFVNLDEIPAGQGVSEKFDIEYRDNGEVYFVEVKTGDPDSFDISPDELQFAMKIGKKYRLFIVYALDHEPPYFYEVEREFWKNKEKYFRNDIIEKIHYTIK